MLNAGDKGFPFGSKPGQNQACAGTDIRGMDMTARQGLPAFNKCAAGPHFDLGAHSAQLGHMTEPLRINFLRDDASSLGKQQQRR
ncbi:hypothetical protein D3C75_1161340 [compost metagenome]